MRWGSIKKMWEVWQLIYRCYFEVTWPPGGFDDYTMYIVIQCMIHSGYMDYRGPWVAHLIERLVNPVIIFILPSSRVSVTNTVPSHVADLSQAQCVNQWHICAHFTVIWRLISLQTVLILMRPHKSCLIWSIMFTSWTCRFCSIFVQLCPNKCYDRDSSSPFVVCCKMDHLTLVSTYVATLNILAQGHLRNFMYKQGNINLIDNNLIQSRAHDACNFKAIRPRRKI